MIRLLCVLLLAAPALRAADPAAVRRHDNAAIRRFAAGEYSAAIAEWNKVLKLEPGHPTAKRMLQSAKEKIAERDSGVLERVFADVGRGDFEKAAEGLRLLLSREPDSPRYLKLQARLKKVMDIVPKAPSGRKPWRRACKALTGYVGEKDDPQLMYNGLRYARELDPDEQIFLDLLEMILREHPELLEDRVTPGLTLLESKRNAALELIYAEKYVRAVGLLYQVLQLEPRDVSALKQAGSAYYQMGRFEEALRFWRKARGVDPGDKHLRRYIERAEKAEKAKKAAKP